MSTSLPLADLLRGKSREELARLLSGYSDEQIAALTYDWSTWARGEQLPPLSEDAWLVWLVLAGRGFGKTRTGAEWVRTIKESVGRIALIAPTAADCRDVLVEGESGILACSPPWDRPTFEPSKRRLTWPNGALATLYSADEPDRLRGPQHGAAWCDELAAWRYAQDTWDNLSLGLRLGEHPRIVVTTTPRPIALLRALVKAPTTRVTRGSTYANLANLAPSFRDAVLSRFEGTTLGRQELHAELLDEMPGALWTRARIDELRVQTSPQIVRIVVAVDPAVSSGEHADETGIIVIGLGADGHGYVLEDLSLRASPDKWARKVAEAYKRWGADRVIAEKNQGGELVESVLRTAAPNLPIKLVHASRGKVARAEPIAALYEQGRVHHVGGFAELEDQMVTWAPGGPSPDRVDALVWGATEIFEAGVTEYTYTGVPQPGAVSSRSGGFWRAEMHYAKAPKGFRGRGGLL